MTKPQIWVAAFLALFLLLFWLQRITKENNNKPSTQINPVPQTGMGSENATGQELISRLGCVNCHGSDLTGTQMGPDLTNITEYWSREQLINYLRNPSSFMSSERFKNYQGKYPNTLMPSFGNIDVKELGKIADYLLKKK